MKNKQSHDRGSERRQESQFSNQIVPYAVLGLSLGALGLSFYAITGGPMDNYLASRQAPIAYASEVQQAPPQDESPDIKEILGEGEYDIKVKIDESGERSYILTPKQSDAIVEGEDAPADEPDETEESDVVETDESGETVAEDGEATSAEQEAESTDENELSEEAQEALDEHKSMRLRIRPDRDGSDIYYYVIEAGDTLAMISEHFNIPLGQLMEDNFIEDSDLIYVGEVIFMPADFVQ